MYQSFFGLSEKPFAITPNPRYLYMSERHAEALAHLMYGLNEAGGFIQLTGEVGTGKTTVVRTLLEQLPQHADVAVILNPRLSPNELLLTICEELGVTLKDEDRDNFKALVDALNARLLATHAKGRKVVVIIDEAQNLQPETLEQVRLLTNLETTTHKLMQIILIGQPELRDLLARNDLRQLAQRITGRFHLTPLDSDDTAAYVRHRLQVAGATREIFSEGALLAIHRASRGIPRLINIICDRALLGAYTRGEYEIAQSLIKDAANEIEGESKTLTRWQWSVIIAGIITTIVTTGYYLNSRISITTSPPASITATSSSSSSSSASINANRDAGEVLQQFAALTTTDNALINLFSLWGARFEPGGLRSCQQATAQGLECVFQKGSWDLLRSLNRPAILHLSDEQGIAHQAVVIELGTSTARLLLNNQTITVTTASLSRYWNGDYLLLWRPSIKLQRVLSAGYQGPEVKWLRTALARLKGETLTKPVSEVFDDALMANLADFQRAHRLHPDGIAGLQTQVALDAASATDGSPTLVPSSNAAQAAAATGATP